MTGTKILAITVIGLQALVILRFFLAQYQDTQSGTNNATAPTATRNNILLETNEEVSCVAWRATDHCSPDGPRLSNHALSFFADTDLSCQDYVPTYGSGYCELVITGTPFTKKKNEKYSGKGRIVRAFQQSCDHQGRAGPYSLWDRYMPVFKCDQAVEFLNYQHRARHYEPEEPILTSEDHNNDSNNSPPQSPSKGIVIQIYPSALPSVCAIIKLLRDQHHSTLPIELWHVQGELSDQHVMVRHLLEHFDQVHLRTIPAAPNNNKNNNSYMTKIHTIAYSEFDQVLFLDSDKFSFRDPAYLFDNLNDMIHTDQEQGPTHRITSAIFWKDFWNPHRKDYVMTSNSVVWELLGIDTNDDNNSEDNNNNLKKSRRPMEMEMESGQMVIDRRYSKRALHILLFLAQTFSEWLEPLILVWGDKDMFRLAWYMADTPFHYIQQPPSLAGQDVVLKWASADVVCGITMVQHDMAGDPIFFHRNIAKLSTEADLIKVWEKGAQFVGANTDTEYDVEGSRSIYRMHGCYHPTSRVRQHFQEIDYRGSSVEAFEEKILQFAREGLQITQAT